MIKPRSRQPALPDKLFYVLLLCTWLAACSPASAGQQMPGALNPSPSADSPLVTSAPRSTLHPIPSLTSAPTQTSTPTEIAQICAPFPGASQANIMAAISNPFNPPPPGSDDPHQGVDIAVQQGGIALAGGPVLAVLSGTVAMVTENRFPYGFALLVENPLAALPAAGLAKIDPPTPAPTYIPNPAMTCPALTPSPPWNGAERSLYLLYAHLQEKPAYQPGDPVACGEIIGRVGQSGNALNPHLHLEVRVGPAGARFTSMAHYDNTARPEEMGNYCTWRVSNIFQLIDPLRLLSQLP